MINYTGIILLQTTLLVKSFFLFLKKVAEIMRDLKNNT